MRFNESQISFLTIGVAVAVNAMIGTLGNRSRNFPKFLTRYNYNDYYLNKVEVV